MLQVGGTIAGIVMFAVVIAAMKESTRQSSSPSSTAQTSLTAWEQQAQDSGPPDVTINTGVFGGLVSLTNCERHPTVYTYQCTITNRTAVSTMYRFSIRSVSSDSNGVKVGMDRVPATQLAPGESARVKFFGCDEDCSNIKLYRDG